MSDDRGRLPLPTSSRHKSKTVRPSNHHNMPKLVRKVSTAKKDSTTERCIGDGTDGASQSSVHSSDPPSHLFNNELTYVSQSKFSSDDSAPKIPSNLRIRHGSDPPSNILAPEHLLKHPLDSITDYPLMKILSSSTPKKDHGGLNLEALRLPLSPRDEPVGGTNSPAPEILEISNDGGPLGIQLVPLKLAKEGTRNQGLVVKGVDVGGRVQMEGLLNKYDRILAINGHSLIDTSFEKAQEIFREALLTPTLRLSVVRPKTQQRTTVSRQSLSATNPAVWGYDSSPKGTFANATHPRPRLDAPNAGSSAVRESSSNLSPGMLNPEMPPSVNSSISNLTQLQNELNRNRQNAILGRMAEPPSAESSLSSYTLPKDHGSYKEKVEQSTSQLRYNSPFNTRKLGKKLQIDLIKGAMGLGFTVTTRDNPAGGPSPIYIKNIIPSGSAVQDGRLAPGDRLLDVNGVEVTGLSQEDVVIMLRSVRLGGGVKLLVSRMEDPPMPREISSERTVEDYCQDRQVHTLEIPLNDSGSAGLGISVKGKTSSDSGQSMDLGIYVKGIIHGGAASKDGRLHINDQLLYINDESLINRTNVDAMDALRRAMMTESHAGKAVKLVIARKDVADLATPPTPANRSKSVPVIDWERHGADEPDGAVGSFEREAASRRSMSEKRTNQHKDAKNSQFYMENIQHRREKSDEKLRHLQSAPALPPRNETASREMRTSSIHNESSVPIINAYRDVRKTNESFRVAVDRSYTAPAYQQELDDISEISHNSTRNVVPSENSSVVHKKTASKSPTPPSHKFSNPGQLLRGLFMPHSKTLPKTKDGRHTPFDFRSTLRNAEPPPERPTSRTPEPHLDRKQAQRNQTSTPKKPSRPNHNDNYRVAGQDYRAAPLSAFSPPPPKRPPYIGNGVANPRDYGHGEYTTISTDFTHPSRGKQGGNYDYETRYSQDRDRSSWRSSSDQQAARLQQIIDRSARI